MATIYIRDGASGAGTSWSDALDDLPTILVRGNTYYIADGTYNGRVFSTLTSGSTLITIKKAIESDHGTDTGWLSTYGDGTASFNGQLEFRSSNWILDGQVGGGPGNWTTGLGFKITETGNGDPIILIGQNGVSTNITLRHLELLGKGSATTAEGGGSSYNTGVSVYGETNITFSYGYIHETGAGPFFLDTSNSVFEYIYVGVFYGSDSSHSEIASIWDFGGLNMGDITFRYNIFTHVTSTGGLMWDNQSNTNAHLYVYGNVFIRPTGVPWDEANGVIGGWTGGGGEEMHNLWVYNNTFINIDQATLSTFPNIASGCQAKNNLWYVCDSPNFSKFPTHNYNHFIGSGGSHSEANGTSAASGDPFVDYVNLDFSLTSNTSPGENLGSPYNTDMLGNTRTTWTRGAIEFDSEAAESSAQSNVTTGNFLLFY